MLSYARARGQVEYHFIAKFWKLRVDLEHNPVEDDLLLYLVVTEKLFRQEQGIIEPNYGFVGCEGFGGHHHASFL